MSDHVLLLDIGIPVSGGSPIRPKSLSLPGDLRQDQCSLYHLRDDMTVFGH